MRSKNGTESIKVKASSYAGESRVDFIPVFGGDGRLHSVPVPWTQYIPVSKETNFAMRECKMTKNDFVSKSNVGKETSKLFDAPWTYNHGLYAKILSENESVDNIENAFGKIK